MLIENLKLKNFGPFREANLNFTPGINLILGNNYQGKSHILKAIAFMLVNYKEKKIEDFCNWDSNNFFIQMLFTYAGVPFEVEYNYNEGETLGRKLVINNDENKTFTGSDCITKLSDYFDPSSCRASILSMQGEINLISTKPAQRRENLKKIYDLNFNSQKEELKRRIADIEEKKLTPVKNRIIILENKDYALKEYLELPCTKEVYNKAVADGEILSKKMNLIKKEQEDYDKDKKEIERLNKEIKKEDERRSQLQIDLSITKGDKTKLNNKLNEDFYVEKNELQVKLDSTDWEKRLNELIVKRNSIILIRPIYYKQEELEKLQKKLNEEISPGLTIAQNRLKSCMNGICSECGKSYSDQDRKAVIFEHKKWSEKWKKLNNEIKKLLIKKGEYEKIEEKNKELKNEISKLDIQIKGEQQKIKIEKENLEKEIESELSRIEERKNNISSQIKNLDTTIVLLENQIKDKSELIINYQKQIKNINLPEFRPTISDEEALQANEIVFIVKSFESVVEKNKMFKEDNKKVLDNKKEDEKELEKLKKERDQLTLSISKLETGVTIFNRDFPNFVIDSMIKDIEKGMNNFLSGVYFGSHKVNMKKTKDGIGVFYGKKGKDISISSGYEKQLFSFAYKNSFAQISKLGILFLDEIDSYASEDNSKILFEAIARLSNDYEQTFIITHKSFIQDILIRDYSATAFLVDKGEVNIY